MSQGQRIVTKSGIGPGMHTFHVVMTCFTCGFWAPIWFLHWILVRSRSVTHVPVQPQMPPYPQPPYPPQGYPQQWQQPPDQYPQQQPPQWPQQPPQR